MAEQYNRYAAYCDVEKNFIIFGLKAGQLIATRTYRVTLYHKGIKLETSPWMMSAVTCAQQREYYILYVCQNKNLLSSLNISESCPLKIFLETTRLLNEEDGEYSSYESTLLWWPQGETSLDDVKDLASRTLMGVSQQLGTNKVRGVLYVGPDVSEFITSDTYVLRYLQSGGANNYSTSENITSLNLTDATGAQVYEWEDQTCANQGVYVYKIVVNGTDIFAPGLVIKIDDIWLTKLRDAAAASLRLSFNANLSNLKHTIPESLTTTLGSKYPFYKRSGITHYRQFTLNGIISYVADEAEEFITKEQLYGMGEEPSWVLQNIQAMGYIANEEKFTTNDYDNQIYEKKFREAAIEFLHSDGAMLLQDPREGNMIVRLTNIQLTPNPQLGGRIYSFSAQATEIADCTLENMRTLGILPQETEV